MKRVGGSLLVLLALCSCQPQQKPLKIEQCWADSTKKQAGDLAEQMMLEAIYDDWPAGKFPTDEEKSRIRNWVKVELTDFYIHSADRDTGNFQCGASIAAKYTEPDGTQESTDNIFEFNLVNGEKGQNVIANRLIFSNMVHEMNKTMSAKKNSK